MTFALLVVGLVMVSAGGSFDDHSWSVLLSFFGSMLATLAFLIESDS
jgi:hypothetical protein